MYQDGTANLEEFDFVDFWESDADVEELEQIQSALIDMMTRAGLYFKQPVGHSLPKTGTGHPRIASGCPMMEWTQQHRTPCPSDSQTERSTCQVNFDDFCNTKDEWRQKKREEAGAPRRTMRVSSQQLFDDMFGG